jgi:ABC-type glycerol-3-phosphate transport system substrate-binding protein
MNRLTKSLAGLLALTLALGAFSTAAAQNRTRIVYLSAGSAEVEQRHDQKWVDAFNASQDRIHVEYELVAWADLFTKLYAYIAAGDAPDVVWYAPTQINEWQKMGILEPLDEWLGSSKDTYLPHLLGPGSDVIFDGAMYGAPFTQAARAWVVRRDWLEEAGIDPDSLHTWDDFLAAAAAITDPAAGRYAMTIALSEDRIPTGALHWYFGPGFGLNAVDDFRDEKRDAYIEMLTLVQDLAPYMPPAQSGWTHRDTIISYVNGTVGMAMQGSYFQGDLAPLAPELAHPDVSAIIANPAGGDRTETSIAAYTVGYVMMNASRNKEAAAEFIRYMTETSTLKEWPMNVAPRVDVTIDDRVAVLGEGVRWWEERWQELFSGEVAELVAQVPYTPAGEINAITTDVLRKLLDGAVTPEQAYDELRTRIETAKAQN